MWLLIDIGNSSSKAGIYDPTAGTAEVVGEVISSRRFQHSQLLGAELEEFVRGESIARIGAVSVVPGQNWHWIEQVKRMFDMSVTFFDEKSTMPFDLSYATPDTMGNDRIAVAAGGWVRYGIEGQQGVIVIDAGTAINYEVVLADGTYPGGVIAPGPSLMRNALEQGTAQLPKIDLVLSEKVIGRSTHEAIQSGIMYSMLDSVAGMVHRLCETSDTEMAIVLTGGWGKWILDKSDRDWYYHRDLVLEGIADLMRLEAC